MKEYLAEQKNESEIEVASGCREEQGLFDE